MIRCVFVYSPHPQGHTFFSFFFFLKKFCDEAFDTMLQFVDKFKIAEVRERK
jgi:hypothetical protein